MPDGRPVRADSALGAGGYAGRKASPSGLRFSQAGPSQKNKKIRPKVRHKIRHAHANSHFCVMVVVVYIFFSNSFFVGDRPDSPRRNISKVNLHPPPPPPPNTPPPSPRRPPSHTQQRALKVPSANYKPAPATSSLIDSYKLGLLSQRLHAQRCANSCCIFILIQCTKLRLVAAFAFCISRKASTGQSKISRATAYATSKSSGSSSRLSTWRASMALLWFVIVLVLVASLSDQIKAANANQQKGQIDRR